jgi:hypothetical protein
MAPTSPSSRNGRDPRAMNGLGRLLLAVVGVSAVCLVAPATSAMGALAPGTSATSPSVRDLGQVQTLAARAPGPIAGRGYRLVFRDRFNRLRRGVWKRRMWYDPPPAKGDIFTRKGILHLVSRRGRGYPNVSVTTLKTRSFKRGYFEARMRWTRGNGAWPGFWLLSYRHATNPAWPGVNPYCRQHGLRAARCWSAELDIFEGQGSEPRTFYGTLHRNTDGADGGPPDETNSNSWHPVKKNLTTRYHVYGVRWTASRVTWFLDGKRLFSARTFDSTNQPMFLILDMWTGGWTRNVDSTTPNRLQLLVDWVKVWRP